MKKIVIIGSGLSTFFLIYKLSQLKNSQIIIFDSGGKNEIKNQDLNTENSKIKFQNNSLYFDEKRIEYSEKSGLLSNLNRLRFRIFGGSMNYWGSQSQLFHQSDFDKNHNNFGSWPINYNNLKKYYDEALSIFEFDKKFTDLDTGNKNDYFVKAAWSQNYDPKFIKKKILKILSKSNNLKINFNCTCTDIIFKNSQVSEIEINKNYKVKADYFILSAGAIENTRILLNSESLDKQVDKYTYQNIGRYYMDHPHGYIGRFYPYKKFYLSFFTKTIFKKYFYSYSGLRLNPNLYSKSLGASFMIKKEKKYLPLSVHLRNIFIHIKNFSIFGIISEIYIIILKFFSLKFFSLDCIYRIWAVTEQDPTYESRIILGNRKDKFKNYRIDVVWKLSKKFKKDIIQSYKLLDKYLRKNQFGAIDFYDSINNELCGLHGGAHHFGTTRMSSIKKYSVIDKNCKLNHIENLFISSTSNFPTNGTANSGLTLAAMALRLANHLSKKVS